MRYKTLLFGWDIDTWYRAFKWAIQEQGFEPLEFDVESPFRNHMVIKTLWFEKGGSYAGPTNEM